MSAADVIAEVGAGWFLAALAGLLLLAVSWLARSAPVALVGGVLWAIPAGRIAADLAARGVGR